MFTKVYLWGIVCVIGCLWIMGHGFPRGLSFDKYSLGSGMG